MAVLRGPRLRDPRARSAHAYEAALATTAVMASGAVARDVALAPELWEIDPKRLYASAKRGMDIALSLAALIALLPLLAIAAMLIRLDSSGSVFYRQEPWAKMQSRS